MEKKEPLYTVGRNVNVQPLQKTVWMILKKLEIEPQSDPASPFLGIYPKEMKQ